MKPSPSMIQRLIDGGYLEDWGIPFPAERLTADNWSLDFIDKNLLDAIQGTEEYLFGLLMKLAVRIDDFKKGLGTIDAESVSHALSHPTGRDGIKLCLMALTHLHAARKFLADGETEKAALLFGRANLWGGVLWDKSKLPEKNKKRALPRKTKGQEMRDHWQTLAEEIWKEEPGLPPLKVSQRVKRRTKYRYSADTIRKRIRKPKNL